MGNTILPTMQTSPPEEWGNALAIPTDPRAAGWTQIQSGGGTPWTGKDTSLPAWLNDREEREAYLESCLEQDVAWQIRLNREVREMSQKELADLVGTQQSGIARAEDPTYGKHSLAMLVKIAHAFGCALLVQFVDYQDFIDRTKDTSVEALTAATTDE